MNKQEEQKEKIYYKDSLVELGLIISYYGATKVMEDLKYFFPHEYNQVFHYFNRPSGKVPLLLKQPR